MLLSSTFIQKIGLRARQALIIADAAKSIGRWSDGEDYDDDEEDDDDDDEYDEEDDDDYDDDDDDDDVS